MGKFHYSFKNTHWLNRQGSTLIEILMVVVCIGLLVVLITNLPPSIALIGRSYHQSLAREIASKQIEDKRIIPYENLAIGETVITDTRLSLLPSASGKVKIDNCNILVCTQNEDMKEVTVTINWKEISKDQEVVIKTLLTKGGLK